MSTIQTPDAEDSWAIVELYRWQHGKLPPAQEDGPPLSVPEGLRGMAKAIEDKDEKNFPTPFAVMAVLRYAANLMEKQESNAGN